MLISDLAAIEQFLKKNPAARLPMMRWLDIAETADWRDIIAARKMLPTADAIKGTNLTCFNIGGHSFRLLTVVSYERQEILIRELLTHAQYDKKYVR